MEIKIDVVDEATPWLTWALENKPDWVRKATKSTLWYAQQQIKTGIKSESPGGSRYAERMSADKRHDIEDTSRRGGKRKRRRAGILGNLLNAVGYTYKGDRGVIGWLSNSAVRLGTWHEKSVQETITPKMRRLFFAAGVPLKSSTTRIQLPKRPTYDPMSTELENAIPVHFRNKFIEYLASGGPPAGTRSRRKYIVR